MLMQGCSSKPNKIVIVTEVNCNAVPKIKLTVPELVAIHGMEELHDVVVRIDKQNRVIDLCKRSDHLIN